MDRLWFAVVHPHMHRAQQPQDDEVGSGSSRVNVGCMLSLPGSLLHFYRRVFFYVVMWFIFLSKGGLIIPHSGIQSLYCEDVKIFTVKLWETTELSLVCWFIHSAHVRRVCTWLHLVVEGCSSPLNKVIQYQIKMTNYKQTKVRIKLTWSQKRHIQWIGF